MTAFMLVVRQQKFQRGDYKVSTNLELHEIDDKLEVEQGLEADLDCMWCQYLLHTCSKVLPLKYYMHVLPTSSSTFSLGCASSRNGFSSAVAAVHALPASKQVHVH